MSGFFGFVAIVMFVVGWLVIVLMIVDLLNIVLRRRMMGKLFG